MFPRIAGSISLLIGLYALAVLPVTIAGVGLILLGIGLMTAEAFMPTVGAFAVGGVIAFLVGAAILIDPDLPWASRSTGRSSRGWRAAGAALAPSCCGWP